MEYDLISLVAVTFGVLVPVPQLWRIIKTKSIIGISRATYMLLCATIFVYFCHAIQINDATFIFTNGIGLVTNGTILLMLTLKRGVKQVGIKIQNT